CRGRAEVPLLRDVRRDRRHTEPQRHAEEQRDGKQDEGRPAAHFRTRTIHTSFGAMVLRSATAPVSRSIPESETSAGESPWLNANTTRSALDSSVRISTGVAGGFAIPDQSSRERMNLPSASSRSDS